MMEHVILLHGLWMRAFTLVVLQRRLQRAGFAATIVDYASVTRSPDAGEARLRQRVSELGNTTIHLVGHSLGGLIALVALQREPELIGGRVVCLGSPLRGSAVARGLAGLPGGACLVGRSSKLLDEGLPAWQGRQEVGAIAGRLPVGFGFAFRALNRPHDGTVSVTETELPGLADHVVISASHTGLLLSSEAADQVVEFLRYGSFLRGR